jgi:hypothetical protein
LANKITSEGFTQFEQWVWYRWVIEKQKAIIRKLQGKRRVTHNGNGTVPEHHHAATRPARAPARTPTVDSPPTAPEQTPSHTPAKNVEDEMEIDELVV